MQPLAPARPETQAFIRDARTAKRRDCILIFAVSFAFAIPTLLIYALFHSSDCRCPRQAGPIPAQLTTTTIRGRSLPTKICCLVERMNQPLRIPRRCIPVHRLSICEWGRKQQQQQRQQAQEEALSQVSPCPPSPPETQPLCSVKSSHLVCLPVWAVARRNGVAKGGAGWGRGVGST